MHKPSPAPPPRTPLPRQKRSKMFGVIADNLVAPYCDE
jgi:hypothetical protein